MPPASLLKATFPSITPFPSGVDDPIRMIGAARPRPLRDGANATVFSSRTVHSSSSLSKPPESLLGGIMVEYIIFFVFHFGMRASKIILPDLHTDYMYL